MSDSNKQRIPEPHELTEDERGRLLEHALHEDSMFNERLNSFLVFESILLGTVGLIYSGNISEPLIIRGIGILGLFLTVIWFYVQARQRFMVKRLEVALQKALPEYRMTLNYRKGAWWPFSSSLILTSIIPSIFLIIWIALLILIFR